MEIFGLALLFLASMAVGLGFALIAHRRRRDPRTGIGLALGATVRIRCSAGVLRARFIGSTDRFHQFLRTNDSRLIRPNDGETVASEAPSPRGVRIVHAPVIRAYESDPTIVLGEPTMTREFERRDTRRDRLVPPIEILVEGAMADLLDVSARGLRFRCESAFTKGDRILVAFPQSSEPAAAWVIEAISAAGGTPEYRALLEHPLLRFRRS